MVARYKKLINKPYIKNDMIGGAGKALAKSPYSFKQKIKKFATATAKAPISLSFATAKAATTGVGLGVSRLVQKPALRIKKMISKRKVTKAQNELNKQFGITKGVKKLGKQINKIKRLEAAQQLLISTGKNPGKMDALQKQIDKLKTKTTRPSKPPNNSPATTNKIGRRFAAYNNLLKKLQKGTNTGTSPLGLEALRTKLLKETTNKTAKQRFAEERLKRKIRGYETTKSRYRSVGFMNIFTQSKKDFSNTFNKYQNLNKTELLQKVVNIPALVAYPVVNLLKSSLGDSKKMRELGLYLKKNIYGLTNVGDQALQIDKYNKQNENIENAINILNGKLAGSISSLQTSLSAPEFDSIKDSLIISNKAINDINILTNEKNILEIQKNKATRDGMSIEEIQKIQTKITETENKIKQNELTFYNNRELIEKIRDETKNTEAKLQLEKFKKYTNNLIDLNKGKLRIFEMKNKVTNMFLDEYTKQATYLKTLGTDQNPEDTKILNDYFQGTNSKFKPTNFTNSGRYVLTSDQLSEAINLLTTLKNEHEEEADTNVNKAIQYLSALVILNSSYINTPTTSQKTLTTSSQPRTMLEFSI